MKIIPLVQQSREWLDYRKSHIMASETATIVGKDQYSTPYQLYQRKLGLIPDVVETPAMRRGKDLEPVARKLFEKESGIEMTPLVVESDHIPWMAASLDGYSEKDNSILEIKCNGKKNHDIALSGQIPDSHWLQMQHQMYVTNASKGYYYSFDGEKGVMIEIEFFPDTLVAIIPQLYAFWKGLILFDEPPALTERDYKDMGQNQTWNELSDRYVWLNDHIKRKEEEKDSIRRHLIELAGDTNCKGGGLKLMKTMTKGRVMYDLIPELQGIDLDKHRKDSTTSWRVYVDREEGRLIAPLRLLVN